MNEATPTFYVLHGEDEFTRAQTLASFKRRLGPPDTVDLNTTVLDGTKVTLGELHHACDAIPFLADKRLVIVDGLLSRLTPTQGGKLSDADQQFVDELRDYLPRLPSTTRLVMVEDRSLPAHHPVLKLAKEERRGYVKQFELPEAGALPRWIKRRAQHHGGDIESRAAHKLAAVVGNDLRLLDQEIAKLVTYAAGETSVREEDVETLVPYSQDAVIFDLVDALGHRDGSTAAETLHRLIDEGEHPLGLLGMIVRQFRLLIQVKTLKAKGRSSGDVANILGIHPFPARKLCTQATYFTPAQLEKTYRFLSETDLEIKTGRIDAEVALDLLVAGLAAVES